MEEDQEFTDDEQVVLEDSEDSGVDDANISGIIPFVMERYKRADDYRQQDEDRWLRSIVTIEVFMVQMFSLLKLKSLESLLKLQKQKHLQPMVKL